MMIWRGIFEPKNEAVTLDEAAAMAERAGYQLVSFGGKIYRVFPQESEDGVKPAARIEEDESLDPEMFKQPDVFCLMDGNRQKIAMNDFGPLLFTNMIVAQAMAEKLKARVECLWRALYLQNKARGQTIILSPERRIIT